MKKCVEFLLNKGYEITQAQLWYVDLLLDKKELYFIMMNSNSSVEFTIRGDDITQDLLDIVIDNVDPTVGLSLVHFPKVGEAKKTSIEEMEQLSGLNLDRLK